MNQSAREFLTAFYLDYVNDFLTIERFAEYHGLQVEHARKLVMLADDIRNSTHPEA
jgi:hypothetical protein